MTASAPASERPRLLEPGERGPDFLLPDQERSADPLRTLVRGGPVVLHFFPGFAKGAWSAELMGIAERHGALAAAGAQVFAISPDLLERNIAEAKARALPFPLLTDPLGRVHALYGAPPAGAVPVQSIVTYLLDPNGRVLAVLQGRGGNAGHGARTQALIEALPRPEPRALSGTAPVLLIPRVLSPEDCRRLMDIWAGRNEESGTITMGKGGAEAARRPDVKRRRDHHVTDPALFSELKARVLGRIAPEIARAFCSEVAAVEEFKIVRYDAEVGGFFRPHRDDPIPERAHRRFAMTLNLNDDYEGGHLRFAEFGPHLYRPAAGEAVIFSCGLLHEALDVTKGQRFVLLSFLMDRQGERHRAERAAWFKHNIDELERGLAAQKAGRR